MLKEFKAFVLRGNVVDLAVGVVIGAAFAAIVNSLVADVITPLLGFVNVPDFRKAAIELPPEGDGGDILYGKVINAVISFLTIGAFVFFVVVKPLNHLMARGDKESEPANKECPHCLSSIPLEAKVCASCTRDV